MWRLITRLFSTRLTFYTLILNDFAKITRKKDLIGWIAVIFFSRNFSLNIKEKSYSW